VGNCWGVGFGAGLEDFLFFIESPLFYTIYKIHNAKNQVIAFKNSLNKIQKELLKGFKTLFLK
jgi:hypothetical protein